MKAVEEAIGEAPEGEGLRQYRRAEVEGVVGGVYSGGAAEYIRGEEEGEGVREMTE